MREWHVVGAGLSGATVARVLADAGHPVTVYEKQAFVGGLAADLLQPDGSYLNLYGPHVFHTKDERALNWMQRFGEMQSKRWRVYSRTEEWGDVPVPLTLPAVAESVGGEVAGRIADAEAHGARLSWGDAAERYPELRSLLDVVFGQYTRRMWNRDPGEDVTRRVDAVAVTDEEDTCYFADQLFVGQPMEGYTRLVEHMLDHPRIRVLLCCERGGSEWDVIRTSPRWPSALQWRGMIQTETTAEQVRTMPERANVLNLPEGEGALRLTRYGEVARKEEPAASPPAPRQYPMSRHVYMPPAPGVHWCGRLGTYRYLNMDECILEALDLGRHLMEDEA